MSQAEVAALIIPIVMAIVGGLKPLLEASVLPATSAIHDAVLRILVVLLAVVASVLVYAVRTVHPDALGLWGSAGAGLVAGLAATGLYVVAKGDATRIPPAIPPA